MIPPIPFTTFWGKFGTLPKTFWEWISLHVRYTQNCIKIAIIKGYEQLFQKLSLESDKNTSKSLERGFTGYSQDFQLIKTPTAFHLSHPRKPSYFS